jgi:hypothetical protein
VLCFLSILRDGTIRPLPHHLPLLMVVCSK